MAITRTTLAVLTVLLAAHTAICKADENEDVVTISIRTATYNPATPPVFARVKYNKLCPLVITSDDMGGCELNRNWAFFNGYPVFDSKDYGHIPTGPDFLETPYNPSALAIQNQTLKRNGHYPLTYSDGTGGVRRFTGTSAIWPHNIYKNNYTLLTPDDPKIMIRTRWSFAQHDVDQGTTAEEIASRFGPLSEVWEAITGVGLKVMVEPAGMHTYIDAGRMSDEICWNIFQNGQLPDYPQVFPVPIDNWATGTADWTTFGSGKPKETTRRRFFQGDEEAWKNDINTADGSSIIIGGTHGIGNDILLFLQDLDKDRGTSAKRDQFWVASADEVWEYYHLYNHAEIRNVSYSDGLLTFQVAVPRYKKHQFRELTINIPGVIDGTEPSYSSNVVIGGAATDGNQYTLNIGLEDNIYTHIEELISYYRHHLHNTYVKDDAQYLIDMLAPGTKKTTYNEQLNAEPNYSYIVETSLGDILTTGVTDEAESVSYSFPRYTLSGTDLYETTVKNTSTPYYASTFIPSGKNQQVTVPYTKAMENVVYYSEGEDLPGAGYSPTDRNKINTNNTAEKFVYENASGTAGGIITAPTTLTTLQPGKYKLVACIGDSYNNISAGRTAIFTFKLDDRPFYTCQTDITGIKEWMKEDIVVKDEKTLTVEAEGSNGSRWIDYIYIQKTGDYDVTNPEVELEASATAIDVTDNVGVITLTATTTPKREGATVTNTTIKDANGNILAEANGNTCTYDFTPTELGNAVFTAEGTDSDGKTGLADELTLIVKSDFTLTAMSSLGDNLCSATFTEQTAEKQYRLLYPRFLLHDTTLYETAALSQNNRELHYGVDLTFTLDDNNISRTITYDPVAANVVYYTEGENISGARTWTWDNFTPDYNKGEYYALTLGSCGMCGAITTATVTDIPPGRYRIVAGIGTTNTATYTFTVGNALTETYTPATTFAINTYTSTPFELTEDTPLTVTCDKGKDNSQNWIDYLYIQKVGTENNVTVSTVGYATSSTPYALDGTRVPQSHGHRIVIINNKKYIIK